MMEWSQLKKRVGVSDMAELREIEDMVDDSSLGLPHTPFTSVLACIPDTDTDYCVAQGDDLQNNRPTWEYNLVKIKELMRTPYEVAKYVVAEWVEFRVLLGTREFLIKHKIRGDFSGEEETMMALRLYRAVIDDEAMWETSFREAKNSLKNAMILSSHDNRREVEKIKELIQELTSEECRLTATRLMDGVVGNDGTQE